MSPTSRPVLLPVAAASPNALAAACERISAWLTDARPDVHDACITLGAGREHFGFRAAVVGRDVDDLARGLDRPIQATIEGPPRVVFAFGGQGTQYTGMAAAAAAAYPIIAAALSEYEDVLADVLGHPLTQYLWDPGLAAELARTDIAAVAVAAIQLAVVRQLRGFGVAPDVVLGNSLGEITAAAVAGALTEAEALRFVAERGRLMVECCEPGAMLAVNLSVDETLAAIAETARTLDVAVINGPRATVVAGQEEAVVRLTAVLSERGVAHTRLATSHAFHSRLLAPMVEAFTDVVARLPERPVSMPLVLGGTGHTLTGAPLPAGHWVGHLTNPVLFGLAARMACSADRPAVAIEIGPRPVLLAHLARAGRRARTVPACTADDDGLDLLRAVGTAWCHGTAVNWARVSGPARRLHAPTYAFDRAASDVSMPQEESAPTAPANGSAARAGDGDVEGVIGAAWAEVLGRPPQATGSFIEQGGDSLSLVALRTRLEQRLPAVPTFAALLEAATFEAMTAAVRAVVAPLEDTATPTVIPATPTPAAGALTLASPRAIKEAEPDAADRSFVVGDYPLLPLQEQIVLDEHLLPGTDRYHLPVTVALPGNPDRSALDRAWQHVQECHEALRCRLHRVGDAWRVMIAQTAQSIDWIEADADASPSSVLSGTVHEPFDLDGGALVRAAVATRPDGTATMAVVVHHAIAVAFAVSVVFDDLWQAYQRYAAGAEPNGAPGQPWVTSVTQHLKYLASDEYTRDRAFWTEHLTALPAPDLVPVHGPADGGGQQYRLTLPTHEARTLRRLAAACGATTFATLTAVFAALLGRMSDRAEVCLGMPVSTRGPGTERAVAPLANTAVLRLRVDHATTIDLVRSARDEIAAAMEHARYPFVHLLRDLGSRRRPGAPPFQVMVSAPGVPVTRTDAPPSGLRDIPTADRTALLDLTLIIDVDPDSVRLSFEYPVGRVNPGLVERLAGDLVVLVTRMSSDPAGPVPWIDPLDDTGVDETTEIQLDVATGGTVLNDWDSAVRAYADRCAVRGAGGVSLSFAEVDRAANALAAQLRAAGVQPSDAVGIWLPRSAATVVAILGVLKAGAAFVSVDSLHPAARIRAMLADARVAAIVGTPTDAIDLPGPTVACDVTALINGDSAAHWPGPLAEPRPADTAYIMYTSGTTGRPKGVRVNHRGLAAYLRWARRAYHGDEPASYPLCTSIAFDLTLTSLYLPLLSGGTVSVHADSGSPAALLARVAADPIPTAVKLTVSHLALLLAEIEAGRVAPPRWRLLVLGGEALDPGLCKRWLRYCPDVEIVNEYGPTETVVGCVAHWVRPSDLTTSSVPIGVPIDGAVVRVLDTRGRPVPTGTIGELFVGGAGVADGYHHQPALTARMFVPDPWRPGRRMYRTGDRVHIDDEGILHFHGRSDDQIKINGYRIELGEITSALRSCAGVTDAAAILVRRGDNLTDLVAFLAGDDWTWPEVRRELARTLAAAVLPRRAVRLSALPLSNNGKADAGALARLAAANGASASELQPAPAVAEAVRFIAGVWHEVLGVDVPGPDADFFALGGDSMAVLAVVARLRLRYPRLSPQDLFESPRVGDLAAGLESMLAVAVSTVDGSSEPARSPSVASAARSSTVVVTGATGLVGANVVLRLLDGDQRIVCPVRGSDAATAAERLHAVLRHHRPDLGSVADRVQVIAGDLADESTTEAISAACAGRAVTVINAAADIRHVGPLERFRRNNVRPTRLLADLCQRRAWRLVHISTLSVVGAHPDDPREFRFREVDFDRGQRFGIPYCTTKFEAEVAVRDAIANGLNAIVLRLGSIVGDSRTGRFLPDPDRSHWYRAARAMLRCNAIPDLAGWQIDLTPVDFAAAAIVTLGLDQRHPGATFHICNPRQLDAGEFAELLRELGWPVRLVGPEQLQNELSGGTPEQLDALASLLALVGPASDEPVVHFDMRDADAALGGLTCPAPDRRLLSALCAEAVARGYFPAPDLAATTALG